MNTEAPPRHMALRSSDQGKRKTRVSSAAEVGNVRKMRILSKVCNLAVDMSCRYFWTLHSDATLTRFKARWPRKCYSRVPIMARQYRRLDLALDDEAKSRLDWFAQVGKDRFLACHHELTDLFPYTQLCVDLLRHYVASLVYAISILVHHLPAR